MLYWAILFHLTKNEVFKNQVIKGDKALNVGYIILQT